MASRDALIIIVVLVVTATTVVPIIVLIVVIGAALTFFLWVFALARTTPTRVANTITLNPVMAAIVAAILLGEPIGFNLIIGVVAVFSGIWLASTEWRAPPPTAVSAHR